MVETKKKNKNLAGGSNAGGKTTVVKKKAAVKTKTKITRNAAELENFSETSNASRREFRIYPSIGIARVGNSSEWYIGPESPGLVSETKLRGADRGIKRQAARFRVYEVGIDTNGNEKVLREVIEGSNTSIVWTVSLANKKALALQIFGTGDGTLTRSPSARLRNESYERNPLIIESSGSVAGVDSGVKNLDGDIRFVRSGTEDYRKNFISLGKLTTDNNGRLLVIGGDGVSDCKPGSSLISFADNDGWFDSVSDGPVAAELSIDGVQYTAVPAWVLITVPRYAPYCYGMVTWFDQAVVMARTSEDGTFTPPRTTSFTKDVFPILRRSDLLSTTHFSVHALGTPAGLSSLERIAGYRVSREDRARVRQWLSPLNAVAPGPQELGARGNGGHLMPKLYSGSNPSAFTPDADLWIFLSLTKYQLAHMDRWVEGNYEDDWTDREPDGVPFDQLLIQNQPAKLTEAALESCVGGSFFPGIEGTYDIARRTTYHSNNHLRQELRIEEGNKPGLLTEKMALPWQADFADCEENWWPSQRPVLIKTEAGQPAKWSRGIDTQNDETRHKNMVAYWTKLGFILRQNNNDYLEVDRLQINGIG